jgi:hypothetical protein
MIPALLAAQGAGWHASLYWHLPILIVVISLVYSATRFERWDAIFKEAFRWGLRMTAFLAAIVAALYVLSLFF